MKFTKIGLLLCSALLGIAACVKKDFDAPPDTTHYDPMLSTQATLRELADQALNMESGSSRVMGDTTIWGIVVGDDHYGNIYKQIIIQDTSGGGIAVLIDKTTLYGDYPVGRKVYIKLKGLMLTNYNGLPEIVYDFDPDGTSNGIPSSLLLNYVVKASYPNHVEPKLVTVGDLFSSPSSYLNTLVKLENMQFNAGSNGVVYSDASRSTTRYISDCPFTGTLGMYNSAYSDFQSAITPTGKGTIIGILSIYKDPQFILRDTSDVIFTSPRECL